MPGEFCFNQPRNTAMSRPYIAALTRSQEKSLAYRGCEPERSAHLAQIALDDGARAARHTGFALQLVLLHEPVSMRIFLRSNARVPLFKSDSGW